MFLQLTHNPASQHSCCSCKSREREFFIDNLLLRIHFIIVIIRWTGLATWEFDFFFPGGLSSTFVQVNTLAASLRHACCFKAPVGFRVDGNGLGCRV